MIAFFQNIGAWFTEHIDVILAILTPTNLIALVSGIVMLAKRFKKDKSYDKTNNELSISIHELQTLESSVIENSSAVTSVVQSVNQLADKIAQIEKCTSENYELLTTKVNAIMKVQTLVYSTVKDDDMRTNIHNILTAAETADSAKILELQKQLEHYKQQVTAMLEQAKKSVEQETAHIKEVLPTSKENITAARA